MYFFWFLFTTTIMLVINSVAAITHLIAVIIHLKAEGEDAAPFWLDILLSIVGAVASLIFLCYVGKLSKQHIWMAFNDLFTREIIHWDEESSFIRGRNSPYGSGSWRANCKRLVCRPKRKSKITAELVDKETAAEDQELKDISIIKHMPRCKSALCPAHDAFVESK